jgi:hypothetical protein
MSDQEMKVAKKSDVWHLVKRGMLMQLHFDFETFGLDRDFAQIMSYGDALGDIAGNFVDSEEIQVKRPDRYLADPHALAVTRTDPTELDEEGRDPHPIAMGKIAQRFERGAHMLDRLNLDEKAIHFTTVRKTGEDLHKKSFDEFVLEYPLQDEDGNQLNDVRYHPDRQMISYRFEDDPASPYYENVENNYYVDEDGSKWKFVEPRLEVSGFRIQAADMGWMRANLVKAGFHSSNIFFTHSRSTITNKQKPKNFAVDAYNLALATHAFGPQGEDGLKLGKRIDNRTGQEVASATLTRLMEANTRYVNEQRGVQEGVRMPDGSLYKQDKAHRSPAYDAQASFALANYCRTLAPEIVRDLEKQADEQELRRVLPGLDPDSPPVFAMVRNSYPPTYPLADPVTCLGFDDQLGQMRKAIMVRLDGDLRNYKYSGKKLNEMTGEDFARMIKDQQRHPDALIRPQPIRRWPGVLKLEDALKAGGAGEQWDFEQVDDNFRYLIENPSVCEAIRSGVEIINTQAHARRRAAPANPMMEDQATNNGFGDLDYLEQDAEQERRKREGLNAHHHRGEVPAVVETLYNKAMDIYNYHKGMDELLHRLAIQPHPIDWTEEGPEAEMALENFRDLLKRAKTKFNKKDSPYKFVFDDRFKIKDLSREQALKFRSDLAKRLLNDDQKEKQVPGSAYAAGFMDYKHTTNGRLLFANLSRNFRILDQKDRELDIDYLKREHARDPHFVQKNLEKGVWRIQFYRLSSEPSITATLFRFADMDKLEELSDFQRANYAKLKNLYLNGPPDSDPESHRWPTIPRIERDLKKMEINAKQGNHEPIARIFSDFAKGEAEIFLNEDESQRIIGTYQRYLEPIKDANPTTDAFRRAVNYDPVTGAAYDWITHEISARNVVFVDVPDAHLRQPIEDRRLAPAALVISKISAEDKAKIRKGADVVLRGQQTGRLYYAGPVDIRKSPSREQGFQDFYDEAQKAYEQDAGVEFPKAAQREVLVIQHPVPLAQTRRNIDPAMQSIKVPSLFFDGLLSPRLAFFPKDKPFTGLVMPADYTTQKLEPGKPIRFREMNAPMGAKLTGADATDTGHIYESAKLNDVRRMKVADLKTQVSNEDAQKFGFPSAYELWEKVHRAFLDQDSPAPDQEEVLVLDFEKVNRKSWAYWNPPKAPDAALTYDGQHVPPSAYRMAINDNGSQPATGTGPAPG